MFGYVRIYKPELKVREYEFYRSTYCGLCRAMGKCTGQCSRLTLSYDLTFLALVRMGASGEIPKIGRAACLAHPFQKRQYIKENPTLEYCAAASALLNYHKIKDDISDERGAKRLAALAALPFLAHSRRRAVKKMGLAALDMSIAERLSELDRVEAERKKSVDEPARIFGELLADIFSFGTEGNTERILKSLGASVGRWIYIADALDDWESDAECGRYNPFILLYGKDKPTSEELESIKIAIKNELVSAESALDLMDIENADLKNTVENILFLGLPARITEMTTDKKEGKKNKRPHIRPQGSRYGSRTTHRKEEHK